MPAMHFGIIDFYHFIPMSLTLTLMFTQGHTVTVEKLHEATQMFMMVDCVRKMTVKKSCMVNMEFFFFFFFWHEHFCHRFMKAIHMLAHVLYCDF